MYMFAGDVLKSLFSGRRCTAGTGRVYFNEIFKGHNGVYAWICTLDVGVGVAISAAI